MIQSNLMKSVVLVYYQEQGKEQFSGTAFFVNRKRKQYLVTARHVVENINNEDIISIYYDGRSLNLRTKLIGKGDSVSPGIDVAVLALERPHKYALKLKNSSNLPSIGQQVYLLGFPIDLLDQPKISDGLPPPLIKGAIYSGTIPDEKQNKQHLLDGYLNPGFSGSPAIFQDGDVQSGEFRLFGLVSSRRIENFDVRCKVDNSEHEKIFSNMEIEGNSGIVFCPSIETIKQLIDENPLGCKVFPDPLIAKN